MTAVFNGRHLDDDREKFGNYSENLRFRAFIQVKYIFWGQKWGSAL